MGKMFVIKPGNTYSYYADADNPWEYMWFSFDGELARIFDQCEDVIKITDDSVFYDMLKAKGNIPNMDQKVSRPRIKELFLNSMNRRNSKCFLLSGMTMALLIPVTPLKIYYISLSTLSLILSIICLTKRGKPPKKNLFD